MGRRRCLFLFTLSVFGFYVFKCLIRCHVDPSEEEFLNLENCPACYGHDLCPAFFHGDIFLIGGSKIRYFQFLNTKNVFYGKLYDERVVLKKLAHKWELNEGDQLIKELAGLSNVENVRFAIRNLVSSASAQSKPYFLQILEKFNSSTDIASCPSERFLSYVYNKVHFKDIEINTPVIDLVAEMMYSLFINPEAMILQAFSQNEGWPFPQYRGSCGRIIVEEYVGRSLFHFKNSPWLQRLDLSYQLLQMAELLTDNSQGFALYLTDVNMDNFSVRPDGTLLLVDVEGVIAVDRWKIKKENSGKSNILHQSKGDACKDCLNFSVDDLCQHEMSDHNYYAVCRGILAPNAYYLHEGLLHSIPEDIEQRTNISVLLKECAEPVSELGRFIVVPKLLQIMKSLL